MDTKNYGKIEQCGSLDDLHGQKRIVGAKQIKKALNRGVVRFVILAKNADPQITDPLLALCRQYAVPCLWVDTMDTLGKKCGIDVGAAAAAAVE